MKHVLFGFGDSLSELAKSLSSCSDVLFYAKIDLFLSVIAYLAIIIMCFGLFWTRK